MTQRRPSPPICAGCLRPHIRLERRLRLVRRQALSQHVAEWPSVTRNYVEHLFDHLTIGRKVAAEDEQLHPAPLPPAAWTAIELEAASRLAISYVFGLSTDDLPQP